MSKTVTITFDKEGNKHQKQKQLIILMKTLLQNNTSTHFQRIIQIQYRMILFIINMISIIQKLWK